MSITAFIDYKRRVLFNCFFVTRSKCGASRRMIKWRQAKKNGFFTRRCFKVSGGMDVMENWLMEEEGIVYGFYIIDEVGTLATVEGTKKRWERNSWRTQPRCFRSFGNLFDGGFLFVLFIRSLAPGVRPRLGAANAWRGATYNKGRDLGMISRELKRYVCTCGYTKYINPTGI